MEGASIPRRRSSLFKAVCTDCISPLSASTWSISCWFSVYHTNLRFKEPISASNPRTVASCSCFSALRPAMVLALIPAASLCMSRRSCLSLSIVFCISFSLWPLLLSATASCSFKLKIVEAVSSSSRRSCALLRTPSRPLSIPMAPVTPHPPPMPWAFPLAPPFHSLLLFVSWLYAVSPVAFRSRFRSRLISSLWS